MHLRPKVRIESSFGDQRRGCHVIADKCRALLYAREKDYASNQIVIVVA